MTANLLEVRDLHKRFGGVHVTRGVSLELPAGRRRAIIGPNGAGKSTLFNLLTGWHRPDSGRMTLDGTDLAGLAPHRIARMGMTRAFQVSKVFPELDVRENVRVAVHAKARHTLDLWRPAAGLDRRRAEEIASDCGLGSVLGERAGLLSQGDRKKLELAMAVAGEPRVLLLDEPTAGMSVQETIETMRLVDDLNARLGIAILFTEHDMGVVFNHADTISLLHRGRLLVSGTPDEIRADATVRSVYLGEEVE